MFPKPPGPRLGAKPTPGGGKDTGKTKDSAKSDKGSHGPAAADSDSEKSEDIDLSKTSVVFDAWVQYATYEVRVGASVVRCAVPTLSAVGCAGLFGVLS